MDELQAAWRELRARVEELGAERQQYLELFERAGEAYLITDRLSVICEANGAAVDLLQRRRRALRGKPLASLVPLAERAAFRAQLGRVGNERRAWRTLLLAGESVIEVDVTARRSASGTLCWRLRAAH